MVTHWTIKMTFLIFYLRLSPNRTFRMSCFVTIGLNTAFMVINWLLVVLQGIPLNEYFHPGSHPGAKCIDKGVLLLGPSSLVNHLTKLKLGAFCKMEGLANDVHVRCRTSSRISSSSSSQYKLSGTLTCLGARKSRSPEVLIPQYHLMDQICARRPKLAGNIIQKITSPWSVFAVRQTMTGSPRRCTSHLCYVGQTIVLITFNFTSASREAGGMVAF